jgi:hypothetical protein
VAENCRREFCAPHDVCRHAVDQTQLHGSMVSSLRVFILDYFRISSTEDGRGHPGVRP